MAAQSGGIQPQDAFQNTSSFIRRPFRHRRL